MNKTKVFTLLMLAVLVGACSPLSAQPISAMSLTPAEPNSSIERTAAVVVQPITSAAQTISLSQSEKEGLVFMREEEKLAYEVYTAFFQKWGLNIFQNISRSELTHTNEVKSLLDTYQIADPAASAPAGKFTNPELQSLYSQLISRGSQSQAEALKAGAAIEEIDIRDLKKLLLSTNAADIRQVYENLLQGSYNHLRSFVSNLQKQTGEVYSPQYLSVEEYQSIINMSSGTSGGQGRRGAGGPAK